MVWELDILVRSWKPSRSTTKEERTRTSALPDSHSASTRVAGKTTSTIVPAFLVDWIAKLARLASTSALVSGRPRPVPPRRGRRDLAERLHGDGEFLLGHADAGVAHAQHRLAPSPTAWSR